MREMVQIRRFTARYRLHASQAMEKQRLDAVLHRVVGEMLEFALERAGVRSSEIICIRRVDVPVAVRLSRADSALAASVGAADVRRTAWVASVNTFRRSLGKHGSSPGGASVCHGGCSPRRTSSDFRSAAHITRDRATSLFRLRVNPWLRIRTTSSAVHLAGK